MTRAQIEARLQMLREELAATTAAVHALGGAIQDCEYWLAVLAEAEQAVTGAAQDG